MNTLPEIKIIIQEKDLMPMDLAEQIHTLQNQSDQILSVTTAEQNNLNGECVTSLRKLAKEVESMRTSKTRPLLDGQRILKQFFDSYSNPINDRIERLKKLGCQFIENENKRVAQEEEKRRQEFLEAQKKQFELDEAARNAAAQGSKLEQMIANRKLEAAKSNVQAVIAQPEPEAARAKGQTMKQVLCYEVTDLMLLVKHNPQLCKIEAKASAIKSTCHPNIPVLGLKLWFESEASYTSR